MIQIPARNQFLKVPAFIDACIVMGYRDKFLKVTCVCNYLNKKAVAEQILPLYPIMISDLKRLLTFRKLSPCDGYILWLLFGLFTV